MTYQRFHRQSQRDEELAIGKQSNMASDKFGNERYDPRKAIPKADIITVNKISSVPQSHQHMVKALAMLSNDVDNAGDDEPNNLEEAMRSPYWPQWLEAMKREQRSLIKNDVWELVNIPVNQKVLTGRWVFKLKKDRYGKILKFKARWVVHGYKQKYGIHYEDTFASVAKPMSWKSLMAISALRRLKIHQMDVVTAFLYGFLDQILFIEQPHQLHDGTNRVCRLRKSLYGLKQSPRVWYETLTDFLKKLDYMHRSMIQLSSCRRTNSFLCLFMSTIF